MAENENKIEQITLTIDGREITVDKGTTVLEAAAMLGIDIPTFCWHPKLDSVGACRMCLVEIEKFPKPAVACATDVMQGMIVRTDSEVIVEARRGVLELQLLNHPLDCPTCDKGGECDLQDNVFQYGIDKSRQTFAKKRNIDADTTTTFDDKRIGPEVIRNMNRCVTCYKCVRFNKEIAGEFDLGAFERGNHVVIDTPPGEMLDNFYSGNVVEICPVGALTNTDWRYKVRVWNTNKVASISSHDADGQNITLWYDHRQLHRTTSRCNDDVDDGWICNIARYGSQYVNSADRLKKPLIKKEGTQVEASWDEALKLIARKFREIKDKKGGVCIGGVVGGNQSCETDYLFNKFFRTVLNSNSVDYRMEFIDLREGELAEAYDSLFNAPFEIADLENADVVFVFGTNLIKDHPAINLRMRKVWRKEAAQVYTANPVETKSADISIDELIYRPGAEAAFLIALQHALLDQKLCRNLDDSKVAEIKQMLTPGNLPEAALLCGIEEDRIIELAKALSEAKNLFILSGDYLKGSTRRYDPANALHNLANMLNVPDGRAIIPASQANAMGAERVGLRPSLSKEMTSVLSEKWGTAFSESSGCNTSKMLKGALEEEIDALMILGSNPAMRYPDGPYVNSALDKMDFLIVADLFETATTAKADVVLPLAAWSEQAGSFVNLEGRVQAFEPALLPESGIRTGIEIINSLAEAMESPLGLDDSQLAGETREVIAAWKRQPRETSKFYEVKQPAPADHAEYPYRLLVGNDLHHFGYLTEHCPSLMAFSPEPYLELSPSLAQKLDIEEGTLVRIQSPTGKLVLKAKLSEYFEGDVLFVPNNFSSVEINSLISRDGGGWVNIKKLDDK
ncbi:MAG: NADH-quinone oxidoreductase subunit NuoG [FCB group bacterium]|nr:NADH-quinone oxidoreductase subunit NuoG [FCB group bacterium]